MDTKKIKVTALLTLTFLFSSCEFSAHMDKKLKTVAGYEKAALSLSKENRALKAEIAKLKSEIQDLKIKNNFFALKLDEKSAGRSIASVSTAVWPQNDLVKFDTYKWSPAQTLAMAHKEFSEKNYEKSAQFFKTFITQFPKDKKLNDHLYFQSGVAAYEAGHYDWAKEYMEKIIKEYPKSKFYRGAKLWHSLVNLKEGNNDAFFASVEEFRKKYRNTEEWTILSKHYENIVDKYKK